MADKLCECVATTSSMKQTCVDAYYRAIGALACAWLALLYPAILFTVQFNQDRFKSTADRMNGNLVQKGSRP